MDDDEEVPVGTYLPVGKPYSLPPPRSLPPRIKTELLDLYIFSDGSAYAGDWAMGMRSGWGVYNSADGCQYLGVRARRQKYDFGRVAFNIRSRSPVRRAQEWLTDRFEGLGVYKYPSGNRYEGEFREDQRHGRGLYLWRNTVRDSKGVPPEARLSRMQLESPLPNSSLLASSGADEYRRGVTQLSLDSGQTSPRHRPRQCTGFLVTMRH